MSSSIARSHGRRANSLLQLLDLLCAQTYSVVDALNPHTLPPLGCFPLLLLCWAYGQVHESLRTDNYGEAWGTGDVIGFLIKLKSPSPEELR